MRYHPAPLSGAENEDADPESAPLATYLWYALAGALLPVAVEALVKIFGLGGAS
jgi:hypothetical protein